MRLATLIVNPAAGRAGLMAARLPAIKALLAKHGYSTEVVSTSLPALSSRNLGRAAVEVADLVLACGGDGTVHGVVQGMAHRGSVLGIVPLGTANALARNLGIPLDPLDAVARLLTYAPRCIPVGELTTATETRVFTLMAGCGPDGALIHALTTSSPLKRHFGRQAYYAHALRLFFTRRWPAFGVEYREASTAGWRSLSAVAVLASRVANLGGLFRGFTLGSALTQTHLRVQIVRSPAPLAFPAWVIAGRAHLPNPWLTTVEVEELRCTALDGRPVYCQADGEPLGSLPISLRIVPAALSLLMPPVAV